jgi:RimJ/RimL family protein N-acetyltransferase
MPAMTETRRPAGTLELVPVTAGLRDAVLAIAPRPEQSPWSGEARWTLPAAESHPERTPCTALLDGVPVAFFILDTGADVGLYEPRPGTVGVRALFVDADRQGQGIGTAMLRALPDLARRLYPQAERLALTVNVTNPVAVRAYLRAGFTDTGRLYRGGALGAQHVLVRDL